MNIIHIVLVVYTALQMQYQYAMNTKYLRPLTISPARIQMSLLANDSVVSQPEIINPYEVPILFILAAIIPVRWILHPSVISPFADATSLKALKHAKCHWGICIYFATIKARFLRKRDSRITSMRTMAPPTSLVSTALETAK
jgi:hypothetical protein